MLLPIEALAMPPDFLLSFASRAGLPVYYPPRLLPRGWGLVERSPRTVRALTACMRASPPCATSSDAPPTLVAINICRSLYQGNRASLLTAIAVPATLLSDRHSPFLLAATLASTHILNPPNVTMGKAS